jgi:hypothetical protein
MKSAKGKGLDNFRMDNEEDEVDQQADAAIMEWIQNASLQASTPRYELEDPTIQVRDVLESHQLFESMYSEHVHGRMESDDTYRPPLRLKHPTAGPGNIKLKRSGSQVSLNELNSGSIAPDPTARQLFKKKVDDIEVSLVQQRFSTEVLESNSVEVANSFCDPVSVKMRAPGDGFASVPQRVSSLQETKNAYGPPTSDFAVVPQRLSSLGFARDAARASSATLSSETASLVDELEQAVSPTKLVSQLVHQINIQDPPISNITHKSCDLHYSHRGNAVEEQEELNTHLFPSNESAELDGKQS